MDAIKLVEQAFAQNKAEKYPQFKAGDTITVTYKIKEGDKFRLQNFRGQVIQTFQTTTRAEYRFSPPARPQDQLFQTLHAVRYYPP